MVTIIFGRTKNTQRHEMANATGGISKQCQCKMKREGYQQGKLVCSFPYFKTNFPTERDF